jgi:hypothetical protein
LLRLSPREVGFSTQPSLLKLVRQKLIVKFTINSSLPTLTSRGIKIGLGPGDLCRKRQRFSSCDSRQ